MVSENGDLPQQQQLQQRRGALVPGDPEQPIPPDVDKPGNSLPRPQSAPPSTRGVRVRGRGRGGPHALSIPPMQIPIQNDSSGFVFESGRSSVCSGDILTQQFSVPQQSGNLVINDNSPTLSDQDNPSEASSLAENEQNNNDSRRFSFNSILRDGDSPPPPKPNPCDRLPIGIYDEPQTPSPSSEGRFEHLFEVEDPESQQKLSDMCLKKNMTPDEGQTILTLLITLPDSEPEEGLEDNAKSEWEPYANLSGPSNLAERGNPQPEDPDVAELNNANRNMPLSLLKRLVLVYGILVHAAQHRVEIPRLTDDIVDRVKTNFPNLEKLEIVNHDLANIIDQVCTILANYSGHLTHLKILTCSSSEDPIYKLAPWEKLEHSLMEHGSSLRHLTIFDLRRPMPLMNRLFSLTSLEEFYYSFEVKNDLRDVLRNIAQFHELKGFGCLTSINSAEDNVNNINFDVYRRIMQDSTVQLRSLIYPDFGPQFGLVNQLEILGNLEPFSKIRSLNLSKCTVESTPVNYFRTLLASLGRLPELKELRIRYHADMLAGWFSDGIVYPIQLRTVEYLTLDCTVCPHKEVQFFGQQFPNLIVLTVYGYYKDCMSGDGVYEQYRNEYFCTEADRELKSCSRVLVNAIHVQYLEHFESLRGLKLLRYPNLVEDPVKRSNKLEQCDGLVIVKGKYTRVNPIDEIVDKDVTPPGSLY